MTANEIRDPDAARRHVLQGLLLSRSAPLDSHRASAALRWAAEVASTGAPVPLTGFLLDLGFVARETLRIAEHQPLHVPVDLDSTLIRQYEDYVVGKLYADLSFERASDALQRYSGRDNDRVVAYVARQVAARSQITGAVIASGVVKRIQDAKFKEILAEAEHSIEQEGWSPEILNELELLIQGVRSTGQLLGDEDIFELESGTALAEFGQRVALRQTLQVAGRLLEWLPGHKPRSQPKNYSVATNIMEEDHYPVGGFTSISNKGTVESLLRSELAYIDDDVRPDLFDIKFARDELLYYSRDENQFLRRRMSFLFILYPHLETARFKDPSLPCQRIVLVLALVYSLIRQLTQWMTLDALSFEILLVGNNPHPLSDEQELLETLFRDDVKSGNIRIETILPEDLSPHCHQVARQSLCQTLSIGTTSMPPSDDLSLASSLVAADASPVLSLPDGSVAPSEQTGLDAWREQAELLLKLWV